MSQIEHGAAGGFAHMLADGGKTNSLGRAPEIVGIVLGDKSRLEELYNCLFDSNAWVRMRAADALEKVCREHPDWLAPYIDRLAADFGTNTQASIQWHLAQIYEQVTLTSKQKQIAITWLTGLLATKEVDWIVAANAMDTLVAFTKDGSCPLTDTIALLKVQQQHKSNAVTRRAAKHLAELMAQ